MFTAVKALIIILFQEQFPCHFNMCREQISLGQKSKWLRKIQLTWGQWVHQPFKQGGSAVCLMQMELSAFYMYYAASYLILSDAHLQKENISSAEC